MQNSIKSIYIKSVETAFYAIMESKVMTLGLHLEVF
jgi:hypothetical protein